MSRQFYETKKIYSEFVRYNGFLTFEEWKNLHKDYQTAYLYVEFYKQIQLAWDNIYHGVTPEEDGLEAVTSVLLKNTPIIINDKNRYTEPYIYTICHRRLINLCSKNSRPNEIKRAELEVSNMLSHTEFVHLLRRSVPDDFRENYIDAFDYIPSDNSLDPCFTAYIIEDLFSELSCFDNDVHEVVVHLMCGKSIKSLSGVSKERKTEITDLLTDVLEPYKEYLYA